MGQSKQLPRRARPLPWANPAYPALYYNGEWGMGRHSLINYTRTPFRIVGSRSQGNLSQLLKLQLMKAWAIPFRIVGARE
jgi:hypothetical protein